MIVIIAILFLLSLVIAIGECVFEHDWPRKTGFYVVLFLALLLMSFPTFAQGIRYDSNVTTSSTNVPVGAQAPVYTYPFSKVSVCGYPATPATGAPCTNTVTAYSNIGLTTPLSSNPFSSDGQGKYGFFLSAGTYTVSITTPAGIWLETDIISLAGGGGGGSIVSISVATANGLQGTSSGGSSPVLTIGPDSTHVIPVNNGSASTYLNGAGGYTAPAVGLTSFQGRTAAAATLTTGDVGGLGTLTNNTTGNAATASALNHTPTGCATGFAPTGIAASGAAVGCAPVTDAGAVLLNPAPGVSQTLTQTSNTNLNLDVSAAGQILVQSNAVLSGTASVGPFGIFDPNVAMGANCIDLLFGTQQTTQNYAGVAFCNLGGLGSKTNYADISVDGMLGTGFDNPGFCQDGFGRAEFGFQVSLGTACGAANTTLYLNSITGFSKVLASNGFTLDTAGNITVASCTGCGGSSGISGLTAGYIPLAGSATTITGNSHISDSGTALTATEPIALVSGSTVNGQLFCEANGVNCPPTPPASAAGTTVSQSVPANSCANIGQISYQPGIGLHSTAVFNFAQNPTTVAGWDTGVISVLVWNENSASSFEFYACNASAASVTLGAISFNVSEQP